MDIPKWRVINIWILKKISACRKNHEKAKISDKSYKFYYSYQRHYWVKLFRNFYINLKDIAIMWVISYGQLAKNLKRFTNKHKIFKQTYLCFFFNLFYEKFKIFWVYNVHKWWIPPINHINYIFYQYSTSNVIIRLFWSYKFPWISEHISSL